MVVTLFSGKSSFGDLKVTLVSCFEDIQDDNCCFTLHAFYIQLKLFSVA